MNFKFVTEKGLGLGQGQLPNALLKGLVLHFTSNVVITIYYYYTSKLAALNSELLVVKLL